MKDDGDRDEKEEVLSAIAQRIDEIMVDSLAPPNHGYLPRSYCDLAGIKYPSNVMRVTPNGLYVEYNSNGFAVEEAFPADSI